MAKRISKQQLLELWRKAWTNNAHETDRALQCAGVLGHLTGSLVEVLDLTQEERAELLECLMVRPAPLERRTDVNRDGH